MTTAVSKPLTPIERSVLESLAEGHDDVQTGAQLRVPVATVTAIQHRFGPSRAAIQDVLAADRRLRPSTNGQRATTQPADPAAASIEQVLAQAAAHSQPRIRAQADKITTALDKLRAAVAREEQEEAARAEVVRLEAELAKARVAAGLNPRTRRSGNTIAQRQAMANLRAAQDRWLEARGLTFSEAFAWAHNNGHQKHGSLLSSAARQAWDEVHRVDSVAIPRAGGGASMPSAMTGAWAA